MRAEPAGGRAAGELASFTLRLNPFVDPVLEHYHHLQLDAAVRAKVLSASAATIDRTFPTPHVS